MKVMRRMRLITAMVMVIMRMILTLAMMVVCLWW